MSQQIIEFHTQPHLLDVIPRPYPASRCIPQWYREMPNQCQGADTIKRCVPFVEAMMCGYIIPTAADMTITVTRDKVDVRMEGFDRPVVQFHPQAQFPGAPFGGMPVIKFANLWYIKTPPGFSCLILPPLNRADAPIFPLAGVVETDTYYNDIAFPSLCLVKPGQEAFLPRGSPLVQVVPFARQQWDCTFSCWNAEEAGKTHAAIAANQHLYRDQYWQKKTYA